MQEPQIKEQGIIDSLSTLAKLQIIDFQRCNGLWENNSYTAMQVISSIMVNSFMYTIADVPLYQYPTDTSWPGWKHVGRTHEPLGRLYWNKFRWTRPSDILRFHDSPDFSGKITRKDGHIACFYGDIGQVSASTFVLDVLEDLHEGDLWISVSDEN